MNKMQTTCLFWNPFKGVNLEKGLLDYYNLTNVNDVSSRCLKINSTNPVDSLVEAKFLKETDNKIYRGTWWFENFNDASKIRDIGGIKQIINKVELPNNDEKVFVPQYKKGKRLDNYRVKIEEFKDCVGNLTRQQTEFLAREISKEVGQDYSTLTIQGFYDSVAKNEVIRKQLQVGWTHVLHGFIRPEMGISTVRACVDADGNRFASSCRPSSEGCYEFAFLERI